MPRYSNVALVLEGGGMRAAVGAGLVSALIDANITFPFISAVSAGATIASSFITSDATRMRNSFVKLAADPHFGGFGSMLKRDGYFNSRYIYEETGYREGVLPYDFELFEQSQVQLSIGAFARDDGKMRYFDRGDIRSLRDLMRIMRASASLPFVMPPTWIDGVCYVDGGLGESIPLSAAAQAGYKRFFIIRTQPQGYRKSLDNHPDWINLLKYKYPFMAEALSTRPLRYNAQVDMIEELVDLGHAYMVCPNVMPISRAERSVESIERAYQYGRMQGLRELPNWQAFLEKANEEVL